MFRNLGLLSSFTLPRISRLPTLRLTPLKQPRSPSAAWDFLESPLGPFGAHFAPEQADRSQGKGSLLGNQLPGQTFGMTRLEAGMGLRDGKRSSYK